MSREQQIEEMAKDSGGCDKLHVSCEKCWCKELNECSAYIYAKSFYEQGYRKQSAVVKDFTKRLMNRLSRAGEISGKSNCPTGKDDLYTLIKELMIYYE